MLTPPAVVLCPEGDEDAGAVLPRLLLLPLVAMAAPPPPPMAARVPSIALMTKERPASRARTSALPAAKVPNEALNAEEVLRSRPPPPLPDEGGPCAACDEPEGVLNDRPCTPPPPPPSPWEEPAAVAAYDPPAPPPLPLSAAAPSTSSTCRPEASRPPPPPPLHCEKEGRPLGPPPR